MDTPSSENNSVLETSTKVGFFKRFLPLILILFLLFLTFFAIFITRLLTNSPDQTADEPFATPTIIPLLNFSITNTFPADGDTNIYPGEISITFDTSVPMRSQRDYSLEVTPSLTNPPALNSFFPTQKISYGIVGNLEKNTTYTVTVLNITGELVKQWSFTTSNETPESSSRQAKIEQDLAIKNYYPLFYDLPYETNQFKIDYTDRLTLEVDIKSGTKDAVSKMVDDWIISKGVDPASHTINYVEN